jgi:hypothetical protein
MELVGKWFVFWAAVGVRLGLAGLRQILQPSFTAEICDPEWKNDPLMEWAPWPGQSANQELTLEPGFERRKPM